MKRASRLGRKNNETGTRTCPGTRFRLGWPSENPLRIIAVMVNKQGGGGENEAKPLLGKSHHYAGVALA
jgi:hypothetical protein